MFLSVEYPAVKRVFRELREMDAEFVDELQREVATFISKRRTQPGTKFKWASTLVELIIMDGPLMFLSVEYTAVKRVYNELREMDAEFVEELRREVATFIGRAKRRTTSGLGGAGRK